MEGATNRPNSSWAARWRSRSSGEVEVLSVTLCTALMARIMGPSSSLFAPCLRDQRLDNGFQTFG